MQRTLVTLFAPVLALMCAAATGQQPAGGQASVSGTFKGNGKQAKLMFVSARWGEPFNDKPGIKLVFTEKDHSRDPKPDFNAAFGRYGSALIVSLHEDGGIFGCEVAHSALKGTFSSIGKIKANDFKIDKGMVQGQLTTGGPADFFGESWEVDLKFSAPLVGSPTAAEPAKPATSKSAAPKSETAAKKEVPAQPAAGALRVKELPLAADATDVEYKKLVQHIGFKSASDYQSVAIELVKKLTAQGWKIEDADRVAEKRRIAPKSYILDCKRGDATLTIFVKPADSGSTVSIHSQGLNWDAP
jgi:hypothetical protein